MEAIATKPVPTQPFSEQDTYEGIIQLADYVSWIQSEHTKATPLHEQIMAVSSEVYHADNLSFFNKQSDVKLDSFKEELDKDGQFLHDEIMFHVMLAGYGKTTYLLYNQNIETRYVTLRNKKQMMEIALNVLVNGWLVSVGDIETYQHLIDPAQ